MIALIQSNLVTLLAALLIGIVTGWWAFGGRGAEAASETDKPEDEIPS